MTTSPHIPVLLHDILIHLDIQPTDHVCDFTAGFGGHGQEIIKKLNSQGKYIGLDQDITAVNYCKNLYKTQTNCHIHHVNFKDFDTALKHHQLNSIDKCLIDLGISSYQLDEASRGFSHRNDAPLDMRMNQDQQQNAQTILNSYSSSQLSDLFYNYGELKHNRNLVDNIYRQRKKNPIKSTFQLCELIRKSYAFKNNHKLYVKTCSKVFQAIRMEVNQELNTIESTLTKLENYIHTTSIIAIITFHSLEDRLVKQLIKKSAILTFEPKKVIKPTYQECLKNPRARSAKCRIIKHKTPK